MKVRCELCNKVISRETFNSHVTKEGLLKNKGECDNCAKETRNLLAKLLKGGDKIF